MAAGEKLPGTIYAHGWWLAEGRKMSKSLGNFISIELMDAYAQRYSLDALRWYLLTQGPLGANDADFAHAKFIDSFNADLANGIGNSTSRVANMIGKYFDGRVPKSAGDLTTWQTATPFDFELVDAKNAIVQGSRDQVVLSTMRLKTKPGVSPVFGWQTITGNLENRLNAFDIAAAVRLGMQLVGGVDLFINRTEPFKLAKFADADPAKRDELANILTACAEALRVAALLLSPAMPQKMAQVLKDWSSEPPIGVPLAELVRVDGPHSLKAGTPIVKGAILFQRADPAEAAPVPSAPPPGTVAAGGH
jgi:methionyl-tRNA synthetase